MRDLTPSNDMKPEDARSICQYLTANRVRFKRKFHEDYKGVDYKLNDVETAEKMLKEMSEHRFIGPKFDLKLVGSDGMFVALVKNDDEDDE